MFFTAHMLQKIFARSKRCGSFPSEIASRHPCFFFLAFAAVFFAFDVECITIVCPLALFHSSQAVPTQCRTQLSTRHLKVSTCVCMFSEHQRPYRSDALHGSKRLRKNIADLFASNAVSAVVSRTKSKRLAVRNRSKNASRDLRAKLLRDSLWPST